MRTWPDGWRHLRFLLLYSPRWTFMYPGGLLMLLGLVVGGWLLIGPRLIAGVTLDVHTLLYAALAEMIGFQAVLFAVFTKTFATREGLLPEDRRLEGMFRYVTLETGLVVGTVLLLAGGGLSVYALGAWRAVEFGALDPSRTLRMVIPAVTALALGFEVLLGSFFLSVLRLRRR